MTLVDTSSFVHFLRRKGDPAVKERVRGLVARAEAVVSDMVMIELWMGVASADDRREIQRIEDTVPLLPTTAAVWQGSRRLAAACRRMGAPVPASDLVIAACAYVHGVALDTTDAHFQLLEKAWSEVLA